MESNLQAFRSSEFEPNGNTAKRRRSKVEEKKIDTVLLPTTIVKY